MDEASSGKDGDRIKVWFRFVPREGWFPQDTEGLWATIPRVWTAFPSCRTESPRGTSCGFRPTGKGVTGPRNA